MTRGTSLRYVDATRPPGPFRRWIAAVALTRPLLFLSRHVSWHLDPFLLRVTNGRVATTVVVPAAVLETRGARTGLRRRNAVIYWNDGRRVVIAASQAGAPTNPSWYHNLVANPDVLLNGVPMRATRVDDPDDVARLWALGDRVFPAFETYRRRAEAAGRTIPVIELLRADGGTTSPERGGDPDARPLRPPPGNRRTSPATGSTPNSA